MKQLKPILGFTQLLVVLLLLMSWIFALLMLLKISPYSLTLYPSLIIFSSSILLMLLLVKLNKTSLLSSLSIKKTQGLWILTAVIIGWSFWHLDQWFTHWLFIAEIEQEIIKWRQYTDIYHFQSVLISTVFLAPLFEEFIFRGLILNTLKQKLSNNSAIVISALLFTAIHWDLKATLSLFMIGLIYGWLCIKSKSILPAILAHIIHNGMTFWLFYVG